MAIGTISVSPSRTWDPCWSSNEMSDDTVLFAEISASALAGPIVPWGVSYNVSFPYSPGSDCPTITPSG